MKPILPALLFCVTISGLAGCELLQPRPASSPAPEKPAKSEAPAVKVSPRPSKAAPPSDSRLQEHLAFIDQLHGNEIRQLDDIYKHTEASFVKTPNTENRLRLAWVLAAPGHGHSNLWAARKHLQEASHDSHLPTGLARLLRLRLKDIQRNLQMKAELSEANEKIRALTSLEHSMEERDAEVQEE